MSCFFQNIDPPIPLSARSLCTPPPLLREEDTLAGWTGRGVNFLEDARHSSVPISNPLCRTWKRMLYLCSVAVHLPEQDAVGPHIRLCAEFAEEYALWRHPPQGHQGLVLHPVFKGTRSRELYGQFLKIWIILALICIRSQIFFTFFKRFQTFLSFFKSFTMNLQRFEETEFAPTFVRYSNQMNLKESKRVKNVQ